MYDPRGRPILGGPLSCVCVSGSGARRRKIEDGSSGNDSLGNPGRSWRRTVNEVLLLAPPDAFRRPTPTLGSDLACKAGLPSGRKTGPGWVLNLLSDPSGFVEALLLDLGRDKPGSVHRTSCRQAEGQLPAGASGFLGPKTEVNAGSRYRRPLSTKLVYGQRDGDWTPPSQFGAREQSFVAFSARRLPERCPALAEQTGGWLGKGIRS